MNILLGPKKCISCGRPAARYDPITGNCYCLLCHLDNKPPCLADKVYLEKGKVFFYMCDNCGEIRTVNKKYSGEQPDEFDCYLCKKGKFKKIDFGG